MAKEKLEIVATKMKNGKRLDTYELNTKLGGVGLNAGSLYLMKDLPTEYEVQIAAGDQPPEGN